MGASTEYELGYPLAQLHIGDRVRVDGREGIIVGTPNVYNPLTWRVWFHAPDATYYWRGCQGRYRAEEIEPLEQPRLSKEGWPFP